ncbi:hypothetical protein AQJ11_18115 [Streptomyces corchorusii]|uniref:Uncharacterized protein n=2 Tax=Streptomyces TaxID=1883 RepID=A0A101QCA3_STRCK|nr:hypothetical protein AQJ11_18115 [Streptomyces corchorusii]
MLAACAGGGPGGGYTAVGAGPGGPTAAAPSGSVILVPLDGDEGRGAPRDGPARDRLRRVYGGTDRVR